MRAWRAIAIAVCTSLGQLLAWPNTWAALRHEMAWGFVREVLVQPLPAGQARLAVVYDFTVRGDSGPVTWMGWDQSGPWLSSAADPVMPIAEATALAEGWRRDRERSEAKGMRLAPAKVMYRANDPGGTAFILFRQGPGVWTHRVGIGLVVLSLLLCLLPLRGGRRS